MRSWNVYYTLGGVIKEIEICDNRNPIERPNLSQLLRELSNQLPLGHGIETIGIKIELITKSVKGEQK